MPPAVQELGNASGFDFQLQDTGGVGHEALINARNMVLGMAAQNPVLAGVRPNGQDDTPQLRIDVDQARAGAMGLTTADINSALSTALGGSYVNDGDVISYVLPGGSGKDFIRLHVSSN